VAGRTDSLGERVAHRLDILRARFVSVDPFDEMVERSEPGERSYVVSGSGHFFGDLAQLFYATLGDAGGRPLGHDLDCNARIFER
jgi:hypothetical protein